MEKDNICKFSNASSTDLICTEFVYENTSAQSQSNYTDRYILGFVANGSGTLYKNASDFALNAGSAFFINKDTSFSITGNDELSYFYISFYGRRADELAGRLDYAERCIFDLSESCEKIKAFAFDCLNRAGEENTDIMGECVLLYIFSYLTVKKNNSTDLLSSIIRLTEQNFTDSHFSLTSLSALMNYDPKYLSFYFKKHKKLAYTEYLRELRIRHSVFLIEQGITSVKNLAFLSGFSDALYFSKVFKSVMNKSPKEYIASHAESKE